MATASIAGLGATQVATRTSGTGSTGAGAGCADYATAAGVPSSLAGRGARPSFSYYLIISYLIPGAYRAHYWHFPAPSPQLHVPSSPGLLHRRRRARGGAVPIQIA